MDDLICLANTTQEEEESRLKFSKWIVYLVLISCFSQFQLSLTLQICVLLSCSFYLLTLLNIPLRPSIREQNTLGLWQHPRQETKWSPLIIFLCTYFFKRLTLENYRGEKWQAKKERKKKKWGLLTAHVWTHTEKKRNIKLTNHVHVIRPMSL